MRRLVLILLLALAPAAQARPRGDVRTFALIGKPGFPAMAYVSPGGRVYEGTYDNPAGDTMPSRVLEYSGAGALLRSWVIRGQDLSGAHGVQVGTMDAKRRLILLDKSPPRVIRLTRGSGRQKIYGTFPAGVVPNYSAWGTDRSLYVTDYEGATIWRIPPGGGAAKIWLKDAALDGGPFGLTGIRLAKDRHTFVVAMQSQAGSLNPSGRIIRIPILDTGKPGPITEVWASGPAEGPDGFAIARSGNIYISLLIANAIAVVKPDGSEETRFTSPKFDSPSSAAFLGTRLMVANQSFVQNNAANQAILDVEAGERGLKEFIPKRRSKKQHR